MGITGNLKTMELSELLQWLSQSRKTGTLVIDNGEVEKRIFFEAGKVISAAASDPKEYLGHFLVSHGFIDEATLAQAMPVHTPRKMRSMRRRCARLEARPTQTVGSGALNRRPPGSAARPADRAGSCPA